MKLSYYKRYVAALLLIVCTLVPLGSFAQEAGVEDQSPSSIQFADESPLQITINGATAGADNTVLLDLSLKNTQGDFLDNLQYDLGFYAGEALASDGEVFADTKYVATVKGDFPRVAPYQSMNHTLKVSYPKGIPSGTYFFQLSVANDTDTVWTLVHTDSAVQLAGDGSMFPVPVAFVRVPGIEKNFQVLEGPLVSASSSWELVFPIQGEDPLLNSRYEQRADVLKVAASVRSITDPAVLHTFPLKSFEVSETELKVTFDPWEGIKPGSYDVMVDIQNEDGTSVLEQPFPVRWFVDGFFSRILDVKTGTNIYREGDALDLSVDFSALNTSEDTPLSVEVVLADKRGDTFTASKSVTIKKDSDLPVGERGAIKAVSFDDQIVDKKFKPQTVTVTLKRADTGEVIDTYVKTMDANVLSSAHFNPNDNRTLYVVLGSALLVLAILLVLYFVRRGRMNAPASLVIALLFVTAALLYGGQNIQADTGFIDINLSRAPSGDQGKCPLDTTVTFSARTVCVLCNNKDPNLEGRIVVDGEVKKTWIGADADVEGNGFRGQPVTMTNTLGPISYDIGLTTSTNARRWRVDVRLNDLSLDTSWATCRDMSWKSTNTRDISCHAGSAATNDGDDGNCGSQKPAANQGEVNDRGACDAGKFVNLDDTASTILWRCDGIGPGTSNQKCSAPKKSTPDASCGTSPNTCRSNSVSGTICSDWYTIKLCADGNWKTSCSNYKCENGQNSDFDAGVCLQKNNKGDCTRRGNQTCEYQGGYKTRLSCSGNWVSSYSTDSEEWGVEHTWKCVPGNDDRTTYYHESSNSVRNTQGVISCQQNVEYPFAACGTSAGKTLTSFPTTGLCQTGSASGNNTSAIAYSWNCGGSGLRSQACSANRAPTNRPPEPPTVSGPSTGSPSASLSFTAVAIDPDNDQITYGFDWNNDNVVDQWTPGAASYVNSSVARSLEQSWTSLSTHTFQVRAKDENGALSAWAEKTVTLNNTCLPVEIEYNLTPSIVANESDTCRLTFSADNVDDNGVGATCGRTVTCTLDGASISTSTSRNVAPGTHTLTCGDGVSNTETVYPRCVLNPDFREI